MRNISFFQVQNKGRSGNCCLVQIDGMFIAFDLCGTEEKSSWESLKGMLPVVGKKRRLHILCISHGDEDHCGGYHLWQKQVDAGNLEIGAIWHPNYDRTKVTEKTDLPEEYLALHKEIMRRRKNSSTNFGDIEIPLTAGDDEKVAFSKLTLPKDVSIRVLNPHIKDDGDTDWDVNDISLVMRLTVSGLSVLFTGDSSSEIWQDRIIPNTLSQSGKKKWAMSKILVVSHHGSATFFGKTREEVRDADPHPDNYEALNYIEPHVLLVSAISRFPTNGDVKGDQPPHYAAWKWYHKWLRDNRGVKEDDKHPKTHIRYTADANQRLERQNEEWVWVDDWAPDDPDGEKSEDDTDTSKGFVYHDRSTRRPRDDEYA